MMVFTLLDVSTTVTVMSQEVTAAGVNNFIVMSFELLILLVLTALFVH